MCQQNHISSRLIATYSTDIIIYNKIVKYFEIVEDFKKLIIYKAEIFFPKSRGSFDEYLGFLLEEYVHACAFLKNINIIYPMPFSPTVSNIIERYKLNILLAHITVYQII